VNTSASKRIFVIIVAALALAACGKKKPSPPPASPPVSSSPTYYVNPSASDSNPGTQALPFRTITHAMTVATTSGSTVQVEPGDYIEASGEVFPITIPAGVLLIGDETNKGGGGTPTRILGGGPLPSPFPAGADAAVHPGAGSTIAGITITNNSGAPATHYGLFLSNSTVTLRNNTVTGATHAFGIYVGDSGGASPVPSINHVITGNKIVDNGPGAGSGLAFISGGVGSKVQDNVITGNGVGVEYDVAGGDLGGGSAGSLGRNTISCNTGIDLFTGGPTSRTIFATGNFWDHSNPTFSCNFTGDDICDQNSGTANAATINTTGAAQASNPVCP